MTLITVASAKGSPGTTKLAIQLAQELSERSAGIFPAACIVDADPDGGDLAILLGLDSVPGVGTLALAGRHGFGESLLLAHAQRSHVLPGVAIVTGVAGRAQRSALGWLASTLSDAVTSFPMPVVVDGGRVASLDTLGPLFKASGLVLVPCTATTASIVHTRSALISLFSEGIAAQAVVIGDMPDTAAEVARALGHPVAAVLRSDALSLPNGSASRLGSRPGGRRHDRRTSDDGVALLVAIAVGEAKSLATPEITIGEAAPPGVASAIHRIAETSLTC